MTRMNIMAGGAEGVGGRTLPAVTAKMPAAPSATMQPVRAAAPSRLRRRAVEP